MHHTQWQDQYNLQEIGMTTVDDMRSFEASLKAIEQVCTPEKAHAQSSKKASQKSKTGSKQSSTGATKQVPKKVHFEKSCKLCKKHGGMLRVNKWFRHYHSDYIKGVLSINGNSVPCW